MDRHTHNTATTVTLRMCTTAFCNKPHTQCNNNNNNVHILLCLSDFVLQVTRSTDLVRVEQSAETEPLSPELFPNCGDADNIDQWSASSPPSTDTEDPVDMGIDEQSASMASCVRKATEEELPMIVVYRTGSIQVHISPSIKNLRGAKVLKLSTVEYFRGFQERETKKNLAIKCL